MSTEGVARKIICGFEVWFGMVGRSRRSVLRRVGAGSVALVAGCLGGSDDESGDDDRTESIPPVETTTEPVSDGTGDTGSGEGEEAEPTTEGGSTVPPPTDPSVGGNPQYQIDAANTGFSTGTGPTRDVTPKWIVELNVPIRGGPVVENGTVYVGAMDGVVHAFDAVTGATRWTTDLGEFIRTTPAVAGDAVFVGTDEGPFFALEKADGSVRWRSDETGAFLEAPTAHGDTVYASDHHGSFQARDVETGKLRWGYRVGNRVAPAVTDHAVYHSDIGKVHRLDLATGAVEWSTGVVAPTYSSPTFDGDTVYVGTKHSDHNDERPDSVIAITATDGSVRWARDVATVASSPAVDGDTVYAGDLDGELHAFDADTGRHRWTYDAPSDRSLSSPVVADGTLYVASWIDDALYALAEDGG